MKQNFREVIRKKPNGTQVPKKIFKRKVLNCFANFR